MSGKTLRQAEYQFSDGRCRVLLGISQGCTTGTCAGVWIVIRCDNKTGIPLFTEVIYNIVFNLSVHFGGRETKLWVVCLSMNGGVHFVCVVSQYLSQVVSPYPPTVVKVVESHHSRIVGIQAGRWVDALIIESKSTAGVCQVEQCRRQVGTVYARVFLTYLFYELILQP